jgi:hypothetical protein
VDFALGVLEFEFFGKRVGLRHPRPVNSYSLEGSTTFFKILKALNFVPSVRAFLFARYDKIFIKGT